MLLLVFSVFVLLRGHDNPGGGFIGGLVAGGAFALYAMTYGSADARRALTIQPLVLLGLGLLFSLASGLGGLGSGSGYLTHYFLETRIPVAGGLSLSTVFLFDLGVFLVVLGMVTTVLFRLLEEDE